MICFASYNRFHNTILVDTVAVSLINAFICLLVGIFSFATIGNIALEQNMSVEDVLTDGTYRIRNEVCVTLDMINYVSIDTSVSYGLERKGARLVTESAMSETVVLLSFPRCSTSLD